MATKAMIYVPECNVDVFKTDADNHGVEIELLEVVPYRRTLHASQRRKKR